MHCRKPWSFVLIAYHVHVHYWKFSYTHTLYVSDSVGESVGVAERSDLLADMQRPVEQKYSEKLTILNQRGQGLLIKVYNLKRVCCLCSVTRRTVTHLLRVI